MTLTLTKEQKQYFVETGRRGGQARAKAMTPAERRESATKASKAAAKVRTQLAKARKAQSQRG